MRLRALSRQEYDALARGGASVPVFRELPGDLLTPLSAWLALCAGRERSFLLESVTGGERVARYSFLGRDPEAVVEQRGARVFVRDTDGERESDLDLLATLRRRLGPPAAEVAGLPRFTGGAVGYLTWDAVRLFERLPDRHGAGAGRLAAFGFHRQLVAFDHARQRLVLIAHASPSDPGAYAAALRALDEMEADLRRPVAPPPRAAQVVPGDGLGDGTAFRDAVVRAQEHIGRGDIFQVVLSRQLSLQCGLDPVAVYRALRTLNPSPYMFLFREPERALAGASPEMLVRVEGRRAETRPIAGTRPRGADAAADDALAHELLADEKERSEHVMLVDLGRNDLGRVCAFDSVKVDLFMQVERYSHVMHLVSAVSGTLREGCDALDALRATFPAGTLSGAPKIRAMEIVDALEPAPRGLYGGALGYLDFAGNLDFCIAIRTVSFEAGRATVQAGAGIVADSDPAAEQRETEAKAGAMMDALRLAGTL
ncbi:MAG: anthranilate synthase component I family protein [Vicinamibacteria bacterium]|nr:anthranilate synthase component I family protein [Vicinamibacteria bacterium]